MKLPIGPFVKPAIVRATSSARPALLLALLALTISSAWGDLTAQTDLASITVTPLARQAKAAASWQTIYDYSGGDVLPPGTRVIATGKWIEPIVRKEKSGVTFAFPDLPDQPQSAQDLNIGFAVDLPLANYPTRTTINYTMYGQQAPQGNLPGRSSFQLTPGDDNAAPLTNPMRGISPGQQSDSPVHVTGENTLVLSLNGPGDASATLNDKDVSASLARNGQPLGAALPAPGAMLLQGLAIRNHYIQQPADKGDWFAVNSMKIEQLRPPLEASAVAAVDLKVPGTTPVRITIEVCNDKNESQGYLLRDTLVSPGTYRLYWEGINQKQSQPSNTAWIDAGSYTFRLTTGITAVHYAGEINNSTPKYNLQTYGIVDCTALALTPPETVAQEVQGPLGRYDQRKFDTTDSVQMTCISYDARYGMCVGSDGTLINGKTGENHLQYGRGLAVTPPDPNDPTNPQKQFYFGSRSTIHAGNGVFTASLPAALQKPVSKALSSPDWNRPSPGFIPYHVQIGQIPLMIGQQHNLIFEMSRQVKKDSDLQAEWSFRNIRLYEEGQKDPGPLTFDPSLFTARISSHEVKPNTTAPIPPGSLMIEDAGHTVHLKNSGSLNYPFEYNITPHTILAFDVNVIDKSNIGSGNGIGLDSQPYEIFVDRQGHFFNFMTYTDWGRFGFFEPAMGAYNYPVYLPNTLYTDTMTQPPGGVPLGPTHASETALLWEPGFYGLNVSEDGKFLFACNNADNRLEVRDISTDGGLVAKIPVNHPMFATLLPEGALGAPKGLRYIYLTSPQEGVVRIVWTLANNTFSKPVTLTPPSEFAYPRGITYSAVADRIFVCDTFNLDRSKEANQIVVIDPKTGHVLSRFGKKGGVNPNTGGAISDDIFTCPLNVIADSKGALWINDYYSCEVRKYDFDVGSNAFTLERRVLGPNTTNTSHFYWMPGDPPTTVWTTAGFLVRNEAEVGPDGRFTNPRATSAVYSPTNYDLRPYAHFTKIGDHKYGIFYSEIFEQVGDGWIPRFKFGENAGRAARDFGLLAPPGQPPTDLDKAIAASGDTDWEKRPWAWSDLNGNGKVDYSTTQPEFQIAFHSNIVFDGYIPPSGCLRSPDGAFVRTAKGGVVVIPPKTVNGQIFYTWDNAKLIPRDDKNAASDVLAQDGHYYVLTSSTQRHDMGEKVVSRILCYDESGKCLWVRDQNDFSLICLQSLGDGMISVMDRGGWSTEGPVILRNSDGDQVAEVYCQEAGDCWSNGALRSDPDTAYIGVVQAYKVTGLSTIKTVVIPVTLHGGSLF